MKGNASGVIDEIVQTSKYLRQKPLYKDRKDSFAKNGFEYRTAYFVDLDGSYYRLQFSVGLNKEAKEVYNIGAIKKVPFPVNGSKASTGTTPYSFNISQDKMAVNTSISENNQKYSIQSDAFGGAQFAIKYPTFSEAEIRENSIKLSAMAPIKRLTGNKFKNDGTPLNEKNRELFQSDGK